jgi:hypothetical protein
VISDLNMKPMTGLDLLKQIRSEHSLANVRFCIDDRLVVSRSCTCGRDCGR